MPDRQAASDRNLAAHTSEAIGRRDQTVQKLAKAYNALCAQLANLIRTHRAPAGAVAPVPLPSEDVFDLDVDDPIWADNGLDDDDNDNDDNTADGVPRHSPRWLSDENVRLGIRGILQRDRCLEEEERLIQERADLETWAAVEWESIQAANVHAGMLSTHVLCIHTLMPSFRW